LRLKSGVSLTQTRFALSHFCLSNLGADGQHFAGALEFCVDTNLLQEALNAITAEVRSRYPDRLPGLIACARPTRRTPTLMRRRGPRAWRQQPHPPRPMCCRGALRRSNGRGLSRYGSWRACR